MVLPVTLHVVTVPNSNVNPAATIDVESIVVAHRAIAQTL